MIEPRSDDAIRAQRDEGIARIYADWLLDNGDAADEANGQIIKRVLARAVAAEARAETLSREDFHLLALTETQRERIDGLTDELAEARARVAAVEVLTANRKRPSLMSRTGHDEGWFDALDAVATALAAASPQKTVVGSVEDHLKPGQYVEDKRIYHESTRGTGICPRCSQDITSSSLGPNHWITSDLAKVNCTQANG